MIVAIDGPAGAGKSSVARRVAERLGFGYLDTGALYRAAALAALEAGVDVGDREKVEALMDDIDVTADDGRVTLDGRDVSKRIRGLDVTEAVPSISAMPGVREALKDLQRTVAHAGNVVMEGRDLGTVVVPDADVKVFLTASLDERARRRARQLGSSEAGPEFDSIRTSIEERDTTDSSRGHSPLRQAKDAVRLDTTEMTEDQVIGRIVDLVESSRG
jgi:CMP/dCMP kinase